MASVSATLLVPVSRAVKFQSQQNRNCKLYSSTSINFAGSSSRRPSRAVLSSSTVATREAGTGNSSPIPSLREICQGHVLRRTEVGYFLPTDIQREGLPVLFSGRDCILHAQVIFRNLN